SSRGARGRVAGRASPFASRSGLAPNASLRHPWLRSCSGVPRRVPVRPATNPLRWRREEWSAGLRLPHRLHATFGEALLRLERDQLQHAEQALALSHREIAAEDVVEHVSRNG